MGWAKYCEDNMEIMLERQFMMQESEIINVSKTNICIDRTLNPNVNETSKAKSEVKYKDKYIICKDCGKKFLFSRKDQMHFNKMGWNAPKRCNCCRNYRDIRYLMCASF